MRQLLQIGVSQFQLLIEQSVLDGTQRQVPQAK